jgi:hypothetical protein
MHKTKNAAGGLRQFAPVARTRVEQHLRSDHIGFDKRTRRIDRPIDVRFGGEMENNRGLMRCDRSRYRRRVADISDHQLMSWVVWPPTTRERIRGVGEFVERHDTIVLVRQQCPNQCATNETGPACHQRDALCIDHAAALPGTSCVTNSANAVARLCQPSGAT